MTGCAKATDALIVLTFPICAGLFCVRAETTQSIAANRRGIHLIGNVAPDKSIHVEGTAFFVNKDGCLATNLHVLLGAIEYQKTEHLSVPTICLILGSGRGQEKGTFSLLGVEKFLIKDSALDLAVVKVQPNPFAVPELRNHVTVLRLAPRPPEDGELLAFSGFPGQSKVLSSRRGILSCFTVREHGITKLPVPVLEVATNCERGFSGGPLYRTSDAAVVGVVVGGLPAGVPLSSGVTDALPILKLTEQLDREGVRWHRAE